MLDFVHVQGTSPDRVDKTTVPVTYVVSVILELSFFCVIKEEGLILPSRSINNVPLSMKSLWNKSFMEQSLCVKSDSS